VTVGRVAAEETWPLRRRVLRPHHATDAVVLGGDEHPLAAHFGARGEGGAVVGVATVTPEACPWAPEREGAWRLRGMATDEAARGTGVGRSVLRAALDHVRASGGRLVWCNAREGAVPFYEREGFAAGGGRYVDPEIGPHLPMWRDL
jgi:GNAT superfamily N-acetyltransferase